MHACGVCVRVCVCVCVCMCVCVCECGCLPIPMILKLYVLHLSQESQWQSGVGLPSVLGVSSVPGMSLVVHNFRVCYDAPCNDCTVTVHWLFLLCPYDNMLQKWHCHTRRL